MSMPTVQEVLALLERLDTEVADDLETSRIEFKPWEGPKDSRRVAVEYTACMANGEGGVIVFGVADRTRGRAAAIHGAMGYDLDTWRKTIFQDTQPHISVRIEEISVPEGTGKLLMVWVPKGEPGKVYGTAQGLYKQRVGKNCMPLDADAILRVKASAGTLDWSGEVADGIEKDDLDPVEIARARNILHSRRPGSDLLRATDEELLVALGATRKGRITHAGLLLFGRENVITAACPQAVVHYVLQLSETKIVRNDLWRFGLLKTLELAEQAFSGPANPEQELSDGLFKLRIPAFPVDVVREAVLNAVTHRDYMSPEKVLVRHTDRELVITSPGSFPPGISTENILRHEPVARNPTLAHAFLKLGLVESSGVGRKRIFIPMLSYGKRMPRYETDGHHVTLRIFDGSFDERMAKLVSNWSRQGRDVGLETLMILSYLRENAFIDTTSAARLLQISTDEARSFLDQRTAPRNGILERRGNTRAATFHLAKGVAKDLHGKAAYTKTRGLNPIRYAEMVKAFVADHGSITPKECRELLGLGESQSARVEVSRLLARWSDSDGFLRRSGKPPKVVYYPAERVLAGRPEK